MEKNCLNCRCSNIIKNHYSGHDMMSCRNEPGADDYAFCITTEEAKTYCCENYIDNSVIYEVPAQTELPTVINVLRAEMYSNALLFYDAFRGLCRLRIDYAKNKASKMLISAQLSDPAEAERLFQKEKFWLNVQDYWKGKLELSYKWEKDYFGK